MVPFQHSNFVSEPWGSIKKREMRKNTEFFKSLKSGFKPVIFEIMLPENQQLSF